MHKCSIESFQPEQKPNSKPKADEMHVSPAIGNTNVTSRIVTVPLLNVNYVLLLCHESKIELSH